MSHIKEEKIHQRLMHAINDIPENQWSGLLVVMRDSVQSVWQATK